MQEQEGTMRPSDMTTLERRGRIVLALAVLGLFLSVTASMIAGELLLPLIIGAIVLALGGWIAMQLGRR
ncbi:MAG: hypothetical protein DCC58_01050 [Chloroflexi bacterium]|nr:MAG: hypothetical protein DCC58_01050 [Chloroflexota bacterium]